MINSACVFGDSVAKGVIFDAVKNKYSLLKESFTNVIGRQQNILISNFARFGCTISAGSEILKRHEGELDRFDYTVLEFGGNDCDYNWAQVAEDPFSRHFCNTPIPLFREKYAELIGCVRQNGGNPVLLNLPPIDPKRYFRWVSNGLNKENIMTFLGSVDTIYRWQELYSKAVEELAEAESIPLIDIRSEFLNKQDYSQYLCEDGIHPNENGHFLITDAIRKRAFS